MRKIRLTVLAAFLPIVGSADIVLNQGDNFTFSFNPTDFAYSRDYDTTSELPINVEWSFGAYQHAPDTIYEISLFSDSLDLTPQRIITVTNSLTSMSGRLFVFEESPGTEEPIEIWDDMEGVIKFEVMQGSFHLTQAEASAVSNGQIFTAVIPEPSSSVLILVGMGVVYQLRQRVRK